MEYFLSVLCNLIHEISFQKEYFCSHYYRQYYVFPYRFQDVAACGPIHIVFHHPQAEKV